MFKSLFTRITRSPLLWGGLAGFGFYTLIHNKLITDLTEKIPNNAELYADITYGFKTEILAFVCALKRQEAVSHQLLGYSAAAMRF